MPVLGICNGFQVLCESHLLPGALVRNDHRRFVCRDQALKVENASTAWTSDYSEGQEIVVPLKNGEGAFVASAAVLDELEATGRVVARYRGGTLLQERAEDVTAGLLRQLTVVKDAVDAAHGSAERYDASLTAIARSMAGPGGVPDLSAVLDKLAAATRQMAESNRDMQRRVADSRGEIDGLRASLADAQRKTLTDPLTGIANRRALETALATALDEAARDGRPLALIMLDIDHFKRFNDTYGHATGDQVLRLVSATMRDQFRATDTLARYGGEEFAALLPGCGLEPAIAKAETVRESVMLRELLKRSTGETLGRVTVSAGVTTLRPGETVASLLDRADALLYRAKHEGRNRVAAEDGLAAA